jgi:sporulation protein YqfC
MVDLRKSGNFFDQPEWNVPMHIELYGNRKAVVEGCCGVLEYDDDVIRIRTRAQPVRFTGHGLAIRCLTVDALVVEGYITCIDFSG